MAKKYKKRMHYDDNVTFFVRITGLRAINIIKLMHNIKKRKLCKLMLRI